MHVRSGASSVAAATAAVHLVFVGDVGLREHAVELRGDGLALGGVAVDDDDVGAVGGEAAARWPRPSPMRRR